MTTLQAHAIIRSAIERGVITSRQFREMQTSRLGWNVALSKNVGKTLNEIDIEIANSITAGTP